MIIDVRFEESKASFDCDFGEVHNISDGGFERGLAEGERIGYEKGSADGYSQGETAGRTAEWNALWDAIQEGGNKTNYTQCFRGGYWTKETFKPKYNITPTNANACFWTAFENEPEPVDLVELLEEAGVELDLSLSTDNSQIFTGANIKRVGVINATAHANSTKFLFREARKLETVEALILREDGTNAPNYIFLNATALVNINRIEGVFGVSFECKESQLLSKQTFINIINALSSNTSGLSFSAKRNAVNNAFETAEGLADGSTSAEWLALVATKPNWTISLS